MTASHAAPEPREVDVGRAAKLTAWLGIAYAVLVIAAYLMVSQAPGIGAGDDEFASFYSSSDRRLVIIAGLYLMPFAGIAFIWFVVLLRVWISRSASRVDELFSNAQLVSGIIYIGVFFAAAAVASVLAVTAEYLDAAVEEDIARSFTNLGWALMLVFSMRTAAVFVITTSALGRRHGFLPQWFVVSGYLVGAFLLLSAFLSSAFILVMPLWVLALGILLLVRARSLPHLPGVKPGTPPPTAAPS